MLLKNDHRKIEALFEKYDKTKDAAREICTELKVHTMIEEISTPRSAARSMMTR